MLRWAEQMADSLIEPISASDLDKATWKEQLSAALDAHAQQLAYDMAYGLSHELNNPLANIAARARLLAEKERDAGNRALLTGVVDQAMRGCEMIADLMLFARPPVLDVQTWNVARLVDDLCSRARPWIEARQLAFSSPTPLAETLSVRVDRTALLESLWAILRNAIEAAHARIELQLDRGARDVRITIQDDGPGLSEAAMLRAFHPYYSGREAGRGLGLGLCKAQRFIEQFEGQIALENNGGCRVRIHLPIST